MDKALAVATEIIKNIKLVMKEVEEG